MWPVTDRRGRRLTPVVGTNVHLHLLKIFAKYVMFISFIATCRLTKSQLFIEEITIKQPAAKARLGHITNNPVLLAEYKEKEKPENLKKGGRHQKCAKHIFPHGQTKIGK